MRWAILILLSGILTMADYSPKNLARALTGAQPAAAQGPARALIAKQAREMSNAYSLAMPRRSRDAARPDLFELVAAPKTPVAPTQTSRATPSVLLPSDLKASLAILTDRDFELLLAEVMKEAARRGDRLKVRDAPRNATSPAKLPPKNVRKAPLTDGIPIAKVNVVRAAFKAGVKPNAIARQFGLSYAAVRELLK
jgi:hypothetical protein